MGRPRVDTLGGSKHANMKELRFDADDGVWRGALAFNPKRNVILFVTADQPDGSEMKLYTRLIKTADERFDQHLKALKENKEG